ncbi:DNA-binding protein [Mycobacterium hubeiense]|uniref:DNA-binding protein n=1 Tax=Mycobacterium hubeiense TaxID=1867256 RepID=UPI000C7EF7AD|nr:DNA-binding protein [Mycobacterium sp. QGD 101]
MVGSAVSLDALPAKHNVGLTADDIMRELDNTLAAIPHGAAAPLSASELDFMRGHVGPEAGAVIDNWTVDGERQHRAGATVRQLADTIVRSVSTKEAAAIMGIDRSSVSRRLSRNVLWSFYFRGHWRIPRWQFIDGRLLSGLDVIVPAIPRAANPAAVDAFMHTGEPDFGGRTPIEHLGAGGDPTLVAAVLNDLARW